MAELDQGPRNVEEAAMKLYETKLRAELEPEHLGKVIAVEPESGRYVLGATLKDVDRACLGQFGGKPVYIFCVGGGGVKLFGNRESGRVLGRA